ncbi:ABC transporter [Vairimorpha necatrix]|uniref:ABC transporter n=1 Tax=Vairimorpha necatrix TaxID=6039 RepID=A0AAX4J8V5_9MICR
MKKISNTEIIKDILMNNLIRSEALKLIVIPILISTVIYSILEITISNRLKELNAAVEMKSGEISALKKYVIQILIVAILTEVNGFVFTSVVQYIYRTMSKSSFRLFVSLPPAQFNKFGGGEIQTIIERKSRSASELIEIFVTNLLPIILKISFTLFSVINNMGSFAGYIMSICVFIYGALTIGIAIWRANIRRELNKAENSTCNKLQDSLINHETIVTSRTVEYEVQKYDEYLMKNENISTKLWRAFYVLNLFQRIIFLLQSSLIIYAGLLGYLYYDLSPSQLLFLTSIVATLANNLGNVGYLYTRYTQAIINARATYDTISEIKEEIKDKELYGFKKNIKFSKIFFNYENRKVFENVNFEIKKGEKIAIIGKNGSGKSTLMKLFLKFESYNGSIFIDDINIQDIKEDSFRNLIGYIPQNTFLFNETVKYNIKYGLENVTDEEIFSLCKKFCLFEVFSNLENGFDTNVGERGKLLSGGEKQKILLMRAMLRKKEIMILDEPTAALDKESEKNIIELILEDKERTVMMIIHNLELVNKFDTILYINDKNIQKFKPELVNRQDSGKDFSEVVDIKI